MAAGTPPSIQGRLLRVVAYQPPATSDVDEAVERVRRALDLADQEDVDLVLFPECYIGGYFPNDRDVSERVAHGCTALVDGTGRVLERVPEDEDGRIQADV